MNTNKNYTVVARCLQKTLIDYVTGNDADYLFGQKPSDVAMIGKIAGDKKADFVNRGVVNEYEKYDSAPTIGVRFKVPKEMESVSLTIKGNLFYRTLPTYDEQCRRLIDIYDKSGDGVSDTASLKVYLTKNGLLKEKNDVVLTYCSKKIEEAVGPISLRLDNGDLATKTANIKIRQDINALSDSLENVSYGGAPITRSNDELLDKGSFELAISSVLKKIKPLWDIGIICSISEGDDYKEVVVQLVNSTTLVSTENAYESSIFNAGLVIHSEHGFIPYDFNTAKHSSFSTPSCVALGNNCSVVCAGNELETTNVPVSFEHRVKTVEDYNSFITFDNLINEPVQNLKSILEKMKERFGEYKELYKQESNTKSERYLDDLCGDIDDFENEIERYSNGIKLIESRSSVRKAFELMNKTFKANCSYPGWRLFQIVFIVSEINDICYSEFKNSAGYNNCYTIDKVDLIYFPTGGGKTETFFGCCVFASFFDRIRGKNDGLTSIIKYPLRLLASQQLDRLLKLTISANEIKDLEHIGGERFSVGFYAGSQNSPNEITAQKSREIARYNQDMMNGIYRQIDFCPKCKHRIDVVFDTDSWRLKHICSKCGFEPPVYIVDKEIYRYSPTFLISTVDKMSFIGFSNEFKMLLGYTPFKCPKHGYQLTKKCSIDGCECGILASGKRKDPIPTLNIQDELHLINSSLGTFDSHYESLINYYCSKLADQSDRKTLKYIGATATISDYRKHISSLYDKNPIKYPASVLGKNFYSYVDDDDISRIIVGAALYGGSISDCTRKFITTSRYLVEQWMHNPKNALPILKMDGFDGDEDDLLKVLQSYYISIVYMNSKIDVGTIQTGLENQGNIELNEAGFERFIIGNIDGDQDFKDIKGTIHEIEESKDKRKTTNVIIATSSISHGVDVDNFNQIFFFGLPPMTAEYIQAYSRVGRKYTGLVFDVFRLVRDKDKSYFRNFESYHKYKDDLIDPIPVCRYARNALNSTLPGVITALLIHHYVLNANGLKDVKAAVSSGTFTKKDLKQSVCEVYNCSYQEAAIYKSIIDKRIDEFFEALEKEARNYKLNTFFKMDFGGKCAMTNLRDVDTTLGFTIER